MHLLTIILFWFFVSGCVLLRCTPYSRHGVPSSSSFPVSWLSWLWPLTSLSLVCFMASVLDQQLHVLHSNTMYGTVRPNSLEIVASVDFLVSPGRKPERTVEASGVKGQLETSTRKWNRAFRFVHHFKQRKQFFPSLFPLFNPWKESANDLGSIINSSSSIAGDIVAKDQRLQADECVSGIKMFLWEWRRFWEDCSLISLKNFCCWFCLWSDWTIHPQINPKLSTAARILLFSSSFSRDA